MGGIGGDSQDWEAGSRRMGGRLGLNQVEAVEAGDGGAGRDRCPG